MLKGVKIADSAVNNLKIIHFRNFVAVIGEIRQFLAEIS
jgi:hypothetical protein